MTITRVDSCSQLPLQKAPLPIVQVGDAILRQRARELSKEEILSPEVQNLIAMMYTTLHGKGVGLAAPQIGYPLQIAVVEDIEEFHKRLTLKQLKERERELVPFQVIINPKLIVDPSEHLEFFEGCLSVQNCLGIVPRARIVRVECLNERAEPVVINAKGWYARILQHEIDHLQGNLFIDHALARSLTTRENYDRYWNHRSIAEVRQGFAIKSVRTPENPWRRLSKVGAAVMDCFRMLKAPWTICAHA